jgi:hypothetical protein
MGFDGGINLLFHIGVVLVGIVIFPVTELHSGSVTPFLLRNAKKCQDFFLRILKPWIRLRARLQSSKATTRQAGRREATPKILANSKVERVVFNALAK